MWWHRNWKKKKEKKNFPDFPWGKKRYVHDVTDIHKVSIGVELAWTTVI